MLSGHQLAFFIYGSIEQASGGYLFDRELIAQLTRLGAHVDVIALDPSASIVSDIESTTVKPYLMPGLSEPAWHKYSWIVQDELCHRHVGDLLPYVRQMSGAPVVAMVHNLGYRTLQGAEREQTMASERRFLAGVDAIAVNSYHTQRTVLSLGGPALPMLVLYPSISPAIASAADRMPIRGCGQRPLRLLSLGHVSPLKGLIPLLQALSIAEGPPWQLDIVGRLDVDPAYVGAIGEQIGQRGWHDRVCLRGPLYEKDLVAAMQAADAMFLASPEEGFGIAYLEAMTMGLPVLASKRGAAAELIADGDEGWLFDPDVEGDLAQTIARALNSAAAWPAMGQAAARRASRHPSWQVAGELMAKFLLELDAARCT